MRASALKWMSLTSSIINVLVAGTIAVFALYAPQLQSHLHYTSLQVNAIGIAAQLGLYLTVPFLGFLCDRKGPRIVAAWAAAVSFPAYFVASLAYKHKWQPWVLVVCYALLGSTTVSLYLSGLSTVAKNHPRSRGLAMAVITASFGLSSLWQTQVVHHFYRDKTGAINIPAMYISFGALMSAAALLSACTLRIITPEERQDDSDDEESPLLQSGILEPAEKLSAAECMKVFLKDHSSWGFYIAFITLAGPGEVFTNNLGAIYQSLQGTMTPKIVPSSSTQLSLFALSSTIGRLVFGALCDIPSKSPITARMIILIITASLLSFGFLFLSFLATSSTFWISAISIGAGYGGLFTVYPLIISVVWGNDNFATYWGCLATAPAVGSTAFGILYATMYDRATKRQDTQGDQNLCVGKNCFSGSTAWFGLSNLVGVVILLFALSVWRRRFHVEYSVYS